MIRLLTRPYSTRRQVAVLRGHLAALQAELRESRTDPVTGLPTRRYWNRLAAARLEDATAVLLADLDQFKAINDRHGHAIGDLLLARVAHRLCEAVDRHLIVGRFGGDEFAGLITGPTLSTEDLDRLVEAVTAPMRSPAGYLRVGISIGLAHRDELPDAPLPDLLGAADLAMYAAKAAGGGYCIYSRRIHGIPQIADRPLHRTRTLGGQHA